jgi:hypothetical protein
VRRNRDECARLARRAAGVLLDVRDTMQGRWAAAPRSLRRNVAKLERCVRARPPPAAGADGGAARCCSSSSSCGARRRRAGAAGCCGARRSRTRSRTMPSFSTTPRGCSRSGGAVPFPRRALMLRAVDQRVGRHPLQSAQGGRDGQGRGAWRRHAHRGPEQPRDGRRLRGA